MLWVTRSRPKTDRLACPWLIRRFIDPEAEVLHVPAPEVLRLERASFVYDALDAWCGRDVGGPTT
jgi:hypothetical protein